MIIHATSNPLNPNTIVLEQLTIANPLLIKLIEFKTNLNMKLSDVIEVSMKPRPYPLKEGHFAIVHPQHPNSIDFVIERKIPEGGDEEDLKKI